MKLPSLKLLLSLLLIVEGTKSELKCSSNDYYKSFVCNSKENGSYDITKESIKKLSNASRNYTKWKFYDSSGRSGATSIEAGSFSGLGITVLDISDNSLTTISSGMLEGIPNLESLLLSNNSIMDIAEDAFVENNQLKILFLKYNKLTRFPGDSLKTLNLEMIDFNNNSIELLTKEDMSAHTNLTRFSMGFNKLKYLPEDVFDENTKLDSVTLTENSLETLEERTFAKLPELTSLSLDYNEIKALPANIFKANPKLSWLYLNNNKLTILPPMLLSNNKGLQEVNFANNRLTEVPEDFFKNQPKLREIMLNGNQISTLPSIGDLKNLKWLDLQNNYIHNLPEIFFKNVAPSIFTRTYLLRHNPLDCNCLKNILNNLSSKIAIDISIYDLDDDKKCICMHTDPQIDCADFKRFYITDEMKRFPKACFL